MAIGGSQPFVSLDFPRNRVFRLPLITEHHRIVAKANELMALSDVFESPHQPSPNYQNISPVSSSSRQ
jgi:hypothetical protein